MSAITLSAGLVTSKSNVLQLLVTFTKKVTSYLISYFLKNVTSYFTLLVTLLVTIKSNALLF